MGYSTPPEIKMEIEDLDQEIQQLWFEFVDQKSKKPCLLTYRIETDKPGVPLGLSYIDRGGSVISVKANSPWELSFETNLGQLAHFTAYRSDDGGQMTGLIAIDGRPARQVQSTDVVSCSARLFDIYFASLQNSSPISDGKSPTI